MNVNTLIVAYLLDWECSMENEIEKDDAINKLWEANDCDIESVFNLIKERYPEYSLLKEASSFADFRVEHEDVIYCDLEKSYTDNELIFSVNKRYFRTTYIRSPYNNDDLNDLHFTEVVPHEEITVVKTWKPKKKDGLHTTKPKQIP